MNKHSTKSAKRYRDLAARLQQLALALLLGLAVLPAASSEAVRQRASAEALADWAEAEFAPALAAHRFSGLVMTVVKDGEIVLNRGYGLADPFAGTPVNPDATLFRIGSATKVFTATAVAQLLEQGAIASLDDPANKYLRRVKLPANDGKPITVWHLLTHRAGFEDSAFGLGADQPHDGQPVSPQEIARMMPRLVRPAGEVSVYSNFSTALLGVLVEDVSGLPIKQYFGERIFAPLQMVHTRLSDEFAADAALGVPAATFPDGSVQLVRYLPMRPFFAPAGGIITTGADMARFMAAHLGSAAGQMLLKPENLALMHGLKTRNHPAVSGFGMKFMVQQWNGQALIEHGGGWPGFQTAMLMLPQSGVGVFISIMGADAAAGLGEQLASLVTSTRFKPRPGLTVKGLMNALVVREDILSYLLDPWQPSPTAAATRPTDLTAYAGSYWRERRSQSSFEALFDLFSTSSAVLCVEPDGSGALRINGVGGFRQREPDVFWNPAARPMLEGDPNAQALYAFSREDGRVKAMTPLLSVDQWTRTSPWLNPATLAPVLLIVIVVGLTSWVPPFWPASNRLDRLTRHLPLLQWLLLLAVPLLLLAGYGDGDGIVYRLLPGAPARFIALLFVTNLGALVALATLTAAVHAWRSTAWGVGRRGLLRRLHYSVLALASGALLGCLAFFNLIGVRWP